MKNGRKTFRLAAYHFFKMGEFLFPLYALLLAAELVVIGNDFLQSCSRGYPVSFQSILWEPLVPTLFYASYAITFFGILLYFLWFAGGTKSVYALRSLPMGAEGMFWSMMIAILAAVLLLWMAQILAVYAGYGIYRLEAMLYNLPGAGPGMSRLGTWVELPDAPWAPPANELYLAFARTPFLQVFYPRHPFFVLLAAAFILLPAVSGVYLAVSFYGRRWWAAAMAAVAWGCLIAAISMGENHIGQWGIENFIFISLEAVCMAGCTVWMLLMARRLCRKSELG